MRDKRSKYVTTTTQEKITQIPCWRETGPLSHLRARDCVM